MVVPLWESAKLHACLIERYDRKHRPSMSTLSLILIFSGRSIFESRSLWFFGTTSKIVEYDTPCGSKRLTTLSGKLVLNGPIATR